MFNITLKELKDNSKSIAPFEKVKISRRLTNSLTAINSNELRVMSGCGLRLEITAEAGEFIPTTNNYTTIDRLAVYYLPDNGGSMPIFQTVESGAVDVGFPVLIDKITKERRFAIIIEKL